MTGPRQVKSRNRGRPRRQSRKQPRQSAAPLRTGHIVGVIASLSDFHRATRLRNPPDFFELRLDCLYRCLGIVEKKLGMLRAPLIITARDPVEGGANHLSAKQRCDLLLRFLPRARYVDVELRSAKTLRPVLDSAKRGKVGRIISVHDLKATPASRSLRASANQAKTYGADVFKVATRTDTPAQLAKLLEFVATKPAGLAVSAMGMGKLGAVSRIVLARSGSILNYGSLGRASIEGQLSTEQLRSVLGR